MAWYYYSGNIVCPITIKKGVSVAVKPHTRIEINCSDSSTDALIRRGLLRICGKPSDAISFVDVVPTTKDGIRELTPKSEMAERFKDKGVSADKTESLKRLIKKDEKVEVLSTGDSSPDEKEGGKSKKRRKN